MTGGDPAGEFDEDDQSGAGPLLPPEDRLWRHPSEVAAAGEVGTFDATDVRNRWLAREPTRATAWTAGLVGALLATGIVLVGTHLAAVLTRPPLVEQSAESSSLPDSSPGTTVPASSSRGYGLGAALDESVTRLGSATVSVDAFRGSTEVASLGLVMSSDGTIITAAGALTRETSILVVPPSGGVDLVATITGVDPRSGLAVLHVNGMPVLPKATLDGAKRMTKAAFALAITSAGGATYAPASLSSVDVAPKVDGVQVVDASETDLSSAFAPLGSPVLDDSGNLIGLVIGNVHGHALLSPAWLLSPVADELEDLGSVSQGWMGINGATTKMKSTTGVKILAVTPGSAAARAGLVPGDVIMTIDSQRVRSITALQGHLYIDRPGSIVTIGIIRHGVVRAVHVTLGGSHP